jgi:hypothetical protein
MHRRGVERTRHAPSVAGVERQIGAAVDDAIKIVALDRRGAGIEAVRHPLGGQDRHRVRAQMRVERIAHGVGIPVLHEIDMRDLAARVHAGIGAAGALHQDLFAR